MSEIAESIDHLSDVLKEVLTQPEVVMSPLDGMDISSNMLGWVRVETALAEIKAFEKYSDRSSREEYQLAMDRIKKILMEHKP